jgi:3-phosphoshikimate 1-carboxyvinyltransferase
VELTEDGFFLDGPQALRSGLVDPAGDHRIAMAAAVLGAGVRDGVAVSGFEAAQVSFPDFVGVYRSLGGEVS